MRINHNMSALKANRQLNRTERNLDKSIEKLSSGYKINKAADDPAGMSISRKMRTQVEGLEQASRNASDGISVIQTAEGALNEVSAMLQRMRELCVQSSNETYTSADREAIQAEVDQLMNEIDRISTNTEFNTKALLDGTVERKSYTDTTGVEIISVSDKVAKKIYDIKVTQDPHQAVLVGMTGDASYFDGDGITVSGKLDINGVSVLVKEGESSEEIYAKIREAAELSGFNLGALAGGPSEDEEFKEWAGYETSELVEGCQLIFVSKDYGSNTKINVVCDSEDLCAALGLASNATAQGADAKVSLGEGFDKTALTHSDGDRVTITDRDGFEMTIKVNGYVSHTGYTDSVIESADGATEMSISDGEEAESKLTVLDIGEMVLQIGANTFQTLDVSIPTMNTETMGLVNLNLRTSQTSEVSLGRVDKAITFVTSVRSKLGAYQNRLEHSILNLDESSEDMTSAMSRIQDVDMAKEMTNYTQHSVLSQAGTSVLAQANERPQTVLQLLQG
jgi:flagellin